MLKILHVYKDVYPLSYGGVEKFISELAKESVLLGNKVTVIGLGDKNLYFKQYGYCVMIFKKTFSLSSCPISISMFFTFKKRVKDYDLIHFHYPWPMADLLLLLGIVRRKYIITYHSDIVRQKLLGLLYAPLRNYFLRKAFLICATSNNYLRSSSILKKYEKKVVCIPIGISEAPTVDTKYIYLNYNINKKYFIFIGALRYYKGLFQLINAGKSNPDIDILLVGKGYLLKKIKFLIRDLKNIILIEECDENLKNYLIKNSFGLVLPSDKRSEAFGLALLDGASHKKPLISCKLNTGTSLANLHLKTGIEVPPGSSSKLVSAMRYLIDNPEIAKSMGEAAYERFQVIFTARKMASSYLHVYKRLQND